jgi:hypothetical protein
MEHRRPATGGQVNGENLESNGPAAEAGPDEV